MLEWLLNFFEVLFRTKDKSGTERPSPQDWIPESHIIHDSSMNRVVICLNSLGLQDKPKVWLPYIPDTNSMDGVFDFGHNNILIAGDNLQDYETLISRLKIGDIAVYNVNPSLSIIHRIVKIGQDEEGIYFTFKGDNNNESDPYKVRPENITWISIGVIY